MEKMKLICKTKNEVCKYFDGTSHCQLWSVGIDINGFEVCPFTSKKEMINIKENNNKLCRK